MKLIKSILVFAFVTFFTVEAYGQCVAMYNKGQKEMKAGRYEQAISLFKDAMECDPGLSAKCKKGIQQCNTALNSKNTKKSQKEKIDPKLILDRDSILLEPEECNNCIINIDSYPTDWSVEYADGQNPKWLKAIARGTKQLVITVSENSSIDLRHASVIVRNSANETKTIEIEQKGLLQTFNVNADVLYFNGKKCIGASRNGIPISVDSIEKRDMGIIKVIGNIGNNFIIDSNNIIEKPQWISIQRTTDKKVIIVVDPDKVKVEKNIAKQWLKKLGLFKDQRIYSFILRSPDYSTLIPITIYFKF